MSVSIQNLVLMDHSVGIQALDQCLSDFRSTKKEGNKLTFVTQEKLDDFSVLRGNVHMQKMAFIVWLNRDLANRMINSKPPEGVDAEHEAPLRSLFLSLKHALEAKATGSLPGVDLEPLKASLEAMFGEGA